MSGATSEDVFFLGSAIQSTLPLKSPDKVPIFAYENMYYYLATIGIGLGVYYSAAGGGTDMDSVVLSMAKAGTLPSQSWGYTAGVYYGEHPPRYSSVLSIH